MADYFSVRDVIFTDSGTGVTITAITDIPCHLFARTTQAEPRIHRKQVLKRGVLWLLDVRFCFTQYEDNEQLEPGDTLTHTFLKPWWLPCVTAHVYFWAKVDTKTTKSTTAFFTHHNVPPPWTLVTLEPWTYTFIPPPTFTYLATEPWTYIFVPAPPMDFLCKEEWTPPPPPYYLIVYEEWTHFFVPQPPMIFYNKEEWSS